MTPRIILASLTALSLTGCVAAVPMVAQLASGATSTAQLCSMAKVPGQSASLCDQMGFGSSTQTPTKTPSGTTTKGSSTTASVDTAAR